MVTVDIEELATRLAAGGALSSSELRELAASRDLIGLGMLAADVRARLHGARGTFARVDMLSVDDVSAGVSVASDAGEARLAGPVSTLDAAVAAVAALRATTTLPLSGWALHDLATLGPLGEVLPALRAAGLDAIATARLDRLDLAQLHAVSSAGLAIQAVTLGTPLDGDALLDALAQLRAWQAATGVIRACAPLPVEVSADAPTTGFDDMRHVALARLALDNVPHLSAHWMRMGPKLSQSCLLFGADDIDAVPARDDMPHGPRRAIVEEVRRNIAAASLAVVERDGAWQPRGAA
jgi:aminodeoxyfutalosine synthase